MPSKDKKSSTGPSPTEAAVVVAKAGLALTPYGGILGVLLDQLIPSTWQRRTEELLANLQDDFKRLEGKINEQQIATENFHLTMITVMRDMILEPQKEKRDAFRAILLNEAMAPSPNKETDLFIKITEDLTHEHIRSLGILIDPSKPFESLPAVRRAIDSITAMNQMGPAPSNIISALLEPALPDIPSDHFPVILDGIARLGLILNPGSTWGGGTPWTAPEPPQHILRKRTTPLGDRYAQFITLR